MRPDAQPQAVPAWSAADVRRLRIRSSRLVTSVFAGEYRSVFRGRGIEFESVRDYQPGDDIRAIDWNVTARAGRPFVKQFIEEREMTVMLLLDQSASMDGSSPSGAKSRAAAEVCALLILAAIRGNDRVGLLTFSDQVERFIPAAKGTRHAQRLIAELPRRSRTGRDSDLAGALRYLERVQRRGAIVFLISDFIAPEFRLPLAAAARLHDVVAISIVDPLDSELPCAGLLQVVDPETGARRLIDSGDVRVREAWRHHAGQRTAELSQTLGAAGVEQLIVASDASPVHVLTRFFQSRQRRLSR